MAQLKEKMKSVRAKLFFTLCIVVVIIIAFLIIANNFVLETFYLYSKQQNLISVYNTINDYYNKNSNINIELELEKIAVNNNFDILIKNDNNISVYSTDKDFLSTLNRINTITSFFPRENQDVLYKNNNILIRKVEDTR